MARKQGQIIARAQSTRLVRIYQEGDPQTATREYLSQTIHGPLLAAAIISSTATISTTSFDVFRPLHEMKVLSYAIT